MLKLARITRISQVIRNLTIRKDWKVLLKVIQMMFYLILYIHCMACLWFWLVKGDEIWVLNEDFIWIGTDVTYEIYEPNFSR